MLDNEVFAWSEYKIGRKVEYNGMEFYVIKDSSSEEDSVTMLKAEPLTYEEGRIYTAATNFQCYNLDGYCGINYHESSSLYETSYVKMVVDAWAEDKIKTYNEVRLLSHDDLITNLGYIDSLYTSQTKQSSNGETPGWIYNDKYEYWTMSSYGDSTSKVWFIEKYGSLAYIDTDGRNFAIRPVITLSKTVLGDKDESVIEEDVNDKESNVEDVKQIIPDKKEDIKQTSTKVKVENTYMSQSIIIIILGFIIGCASLTLYYIIRKKEGK